MKKQAILLVLALVAWPMRGAVPILQTDLQLSGSQNKLKGGATASVFLVESGATFTISGAIGGTGTFDFSSGTVTLPSTVGGGTGSFQPVDATLTAFAAVTTAANKLIYATASDTFATTDFTAMARSLLDDVDAPAMRTTLGLVIGTNVQAYDSDLDAIAALSSNGLVARTGNGTVAVRTITAPAAGITVSNGDGVSGNPTISLANDLAALEGLSTIGLVARTADGAAATRTITAPAAGITVSNGDGVSGNPTLGLANDLAALEGLATTGVIVRTGDGSATTRTIAGTASQVTVTNGDGVSGAPTISLPAAVAGVNSITSATGQPLTFGTLDTNQNVVVTPNGTGVLQVPTAGIQLGSTTPGIISGSSGNITLTAAGTNKDVTLSPSGTGLVTVTSGLAPSTNNTKDLGTSSQLWATVHFGILRASGGALKLNSNFTGGGVDPALDITSVGTSTLFSGTNNLINASLSFAPTSGTGNHNWINVAPTINQTGGSSGITRGLNVSATITSAADWRPADIVSIIGGTPVEDSLHQARVATTDATVTTIQTVTIPASTTMGIHGYIVARRTGGSSGTAEDGGYYRVELAAKNVAGTATIIGSAGVTTLAEDQAGWDVTVTVSGATVLIKVTGAANNNITWCWTGHRNPVSS